MEAVKNSAVTLYNDFFPEGSNRRYQLNTYGPYVAITLSFAAINAILLQIFILPDLQKAQDLQDSLNISDRFRAIEIEQETIANGVRLTCIALVWAAAANIRFFLTRDIT